ncbi:protein DETOXIFICATION 33-like [Telopea speciosissima]|uniref:protein DETOXIFICATION 33-like n=1 Tax=Telopea speciosissima TaxID=54955 RepID=UPI001CC6EBED|nr:protein DETOXIFICATION 33-like [Telopea speciosissima]
MNIRGWNAMIGLGLNAAISVRVSNELGAGNPRAAKFAVIVVSAMSMAIAVVYMTIILATRDYFPRLFTNSVEVMKEVIKIAPLLAVTVLINGLQIVISGVAVGAGWQALVAYINIGCYYIVGLPTGLLLGFKFDYGVEGIWGGMIGGIVMQTIILVIVTSRTNWNKEVIILINISKTRLCDLDLDLAEKKWIFTNYCSTDLQASEAESRVRQWGG